MLKLPTSPKTSKSVNFSIRRDSDELNEEITRTRKQIDREYGDSQLNYLKMVNSPNESIKLKSLLNELSNENKLKEEVIDRLSNKIEELRIVFVEDGSLEKHESKVMNLNKELETILNSIEREEESSSLYKNSIGKLTAGLCIYKERIENIKEMIKEVGKNYSAVQLAKYKAKNEMVSVSNELSNIVNRHIHDTQKFEDCYQNLKKKLENETQAKTQEIEKMTHINIKRREMKVATEEFLLSLKNETKDSIEIQNIHKANIKIIYDFEEQIKTIVR